MTIDSAHDLLQSALMTTMSMVAPLLAGILLLSLIVNVLQTMTQLHDHVLAFVPRLAIAAVLLLLLLPWLLGRVTDYAVDVYARPGMGRDAMSDAILVNALWAWGTVCLGPACSGLRVLSLLTFGGLMTGVTIPWRFRVCMAGLLGWIAAAPGSLEVDSLDSLALVAASEFAPGAAMGVSVGGLLLGFKLAGELLDDRLRLLEATAEMMAGDEEAVGPCVRLLGGLGLAIVVFGGAGESMPVLDGMLASFHGIPVGAAIEAFSDWHGSVHMLNIALELCLRMVLPILAVVSIVDWCQMLVSRAAPTVPSVVAATAVKPLLGLAMLVAVFGGACDAAMAAIRVCLEAGGAA